ncbi:hypothetical protein GCM10007108_10450 [Thermogymnomonas acidicola]|uniref:Phosphoribosylformylglycinamidine synthase subunit PurS n=1 Tax=Thermogymnomonas acidicola TaxID=399579 RepID=A0AA37BRL3_9ARCH|nr:phosphoribosylformylglycinamidine synthase subunit PurS [Thermogymnomonas acidicola]GGM74443.1 hypothetical protein GCM10007108_10450 [Thermogymnomonas acidicola]
MRRYSVEISLREGVEDPEAITVAKNLRTLGFRVSSVATRKVYEFEFEEGEEEARKKVEDIARKILTNPVIHRYEIRELDP